MVRTGSVGATHELARTCRAEHVGVSLGSPVDERVRIALSLVPEEAWYPAIEAIEDDGELREKAFMAELTNLAGLSAWPEGSRVALRREGPHPGAQFNLFDPEGFRHQVFITNSADEDIVYPEARHRAHAHVEDRIKDAKATGLLHFPGHSFFLPTPPGSLSC